MKINIHYSFLILVFIFLFTNMLLEILIFTIIIFMHELSHAFFAKLYKKKINSITLTMLGGIVEIKGNKLSLTKEIIINLSGILINVILLAISFFVSNRRISGILYNYNLLMILFNLVPVFPLDGFRILEDILLSKFFSFKFVNYLFLYSLIFSIVILIVSFCFKSLGLVFISIFLIFKNFRAYLARETRFIELAINKLKNKTT